MKSSLVIIGAGGHGRVVADIAKKCGTYTEILFLDDSDNLTFPVAGKVSSFVNYVSDCDFVVAIGNNSVRRKITDALKKHNADIATLVHPAAVLGENVKLGAGTVVMAGCVINNGAYIGEGTIVNTCSSVDHDCIVGDFCHISVGAHVAGTVTIGNSTFVGAGATIINNLEICDDCMIAAGAVVIKSIVESGLWAGVPSVRKNRNKDWMMKIEDTSSCEDK